MALAGAPGAAAAATFTVTTTADIGAGTVRQAILDANATPGADVIAFAIPGSGIQTIAPLSALPTVTEAVTIDGSTQPGFSGSPLIELDGVNAGPGIAGIEVTSGGATVRSLAIGRFSLYGIRLAIGGGNVVEGCYVGVDATGLLDRGNGLASVIVTENSAGNQIGGPDPSRRNVLSGSAAGIIVEGTGAGNVIQGNYIGTDASGATAIPASVGILVDAPGVSIGGTAPGAGNVVSGHVGDGIHVSLNADGAVIQGNRIGTDAAGMAALGNTANGISVSRAGGVLVGGTAPGAANLVSANGGGGIDINGSENVVQGNLVGTDATGSAPLGNGGPGVAIERDSFDNRVGGTDPGAGNVIAFNGGGGVVMTSSPSSPIGSGNTFRGNSIFSNRGLGIDLVGLDFLPGPTPNDMGDGDDGPNGFQNYPLITEVIYGPVSTVVNGVLSAAPSAEYDMDFYSNPTCTFRPGDYLQGRTYLGTMHIALDATGSLPFGISFPVLIPSGEPVTATATSASGSTSEFSPRIVFAGSPGSGPASGGTPLTLSGTSFLPGMTATVGGVPVADLAVVSDTAATGTAPALPPGAAYDVVALNSDATNGTLSHGWLADFLDVPPSQIFHAAVAALVSNGISAGCGAGNFCVGSLVTRAQIAPLLLRARNGLCFSPPPATGTVFADVHPGDFAADWIEALAAAGITSGCGAGDYCPQSPVLRSQIAVLLLKAMNGPAYVPPPCQGIFDDVTCPGDFADWIEDLANRGITGGCSAQPALFCPGASTTRGQAAAFLSAAFGLE